MNPSDIVGKKHTFEDGDSLEVMQVKLRDGNVPWVTYHIQQGPGIPRKLVMTLDEFMNTFGQLWGLKSDDILWPDAE